MATVLASENSGLVSSIYTAPRMLRNDIHTVTPLDAKVAAILVLNGLNSDYTAGKKVGEDRMGHDLLGFSIFITRARGREHWIITHDSSYWEQKDLVRLQRAASSSEGITAEITIVTQLRMDKFISLMSKPLLHGNRIADHIIFVTRGNGAHDNTTTYTESYMDKVRNMGFQIARNPADALQEQLNDSLFGSAPQPRLLLPAMRKQYPMRGYPADIRHRH